MLPVNQVVGGGGFALYAFGSNQEALQVQGITAALSIVDASWVP